MSISVLQGSVSGSECLHVRRMVKIPLSGGVPSELITFRGLSDDGAPTNGSARVRKSFPLPLMDGTATAQVLTFDGLSDGREHVALQFGPVTVDSTPLVRLHSECLTGDVFGSQRCDCGHQLREALRHFSQHGGLLLYLRQEGRGIGLYAKMDAYALQMQGLDTFDANRQLGFADDLRDYRCAAEILGALGVSRIRLVTNNPDKVRQIERHGVKVVERVSTGVYANAHNIAYLRAKAVRAQHYIDLTRAQATSTQLSSSHQLSISDISRTTDALNR